MRPAHSVLGLGLEQDDLVIDSLEITGQLDLETRIFSRGTRSILENLKPNDLSGPPIVLNQKDH